MVWRHRRRKSKMKVVLLFVKTNWKSKLRQTRSLPYNPACLHWLKEWERGGNVVALHLVAFLGELIYITVQRQASPCLFMQVCGTPCTPADLKRSNSTNQQPKRQTWSCGHNRTARKHNRKQKNTHFPCWIELFFVSSSNLKGFSSASPHHVRWSHNGSRIPRHSCFFLWQWKHWLPAVNSFPKGSWTELEIAFRRRKQSACDVAVKGLKTLLKSLVPLPSGWTAQLRELGCLLWVGFNLWVDLSF